MDEAVKEAIKRLEEVDSRQDDRIKHLENSFSTINQIAVSVKELAVNMTHMVEEQKKQGERLDKIENTPKENWSLVTKTIITGVVSALISAAMVMLLK